MARTTSMPRKKVKDFGTCLYFAGSGDYVEFTQSDLSGWNGEVSVSFFVWITEIIASDRPIVDSMWGSDSSGGFQFLVYNGKLVNCKIGDTEGSDTVSGDSADLTKKWHHVVFTKSVLNGRQRVYVDNVLKGTNSSLSYGATPLNDGVVLRIMERRTGGGGAAGYVDDFRIYNRELSNEEIERLYLFHDISSGLVHHFKFDEETGLLVTDSAGNATGSIVGAAAYSNNVPCKSRLSI